IPIEVNRVKTQAICDTGSTISIISLEFMKRSGHQINRKCEYWVISVDGQRSRPVGMVDNYPITIGHLTVPITMAVMDGVHYDVLLGNNFLIKSSAVVDFARQTVQFGTGSDTRVVRASVREVRPDPPGYRLPSPYTEEDEDSEEEYEEEPQEYHASYTVKIVYDAACTPADYYIPPFKRPNYKVNTATRPPQPKKENRSVHTFQKTPR